MPFDTTYHIPPSENSTIITYKVTGGKDTDIYLNQGQLPPGMDSFPDMKQFIQDMQVSSYEKPKPEEHYTPGAPMIISFIAIFLFILFRIKRSVNSTDGDTGDTVTGATGDDTVKSPSYFTYYGEALNFSDEEITATLNKHFPYFPKLSQLEKRRFLERIQLFIADKIFKIHCETGFKEMPILISAAAIQLTFGLKKYLLPYFKYIHVYPEEFLGMHPSIRMLEGNVSGHAINLSWKHFLDGYENTTDGQNVGLHELAHALYYQAFVVEESVDNNFRDTFTDFNNIGNKVFNQEQEPGNDLYSDYALKNFQEFWAESMEIFFEKPHQMKGAYPALYASMVELLNQDPCSTTPLV